MKREKSKIIKKEFKELSALAVPRQMTRDNKHRFSDVVQLLHGYYDSHMVSQKGTDGVLHDLTTRGTLLPSSLMESFHTFRRTMVRSTFGAQIVDFKMHSTLIAVNSVTSILNSVTGISFQGLANYSDLAAVFDEYQFTRNGEIVYYPNTQNFNAATGPSTVPMAIGVIDYDDSSILSSVGNALSYDTARILALSPSYDSSDALRCAVRWPLVFIGQPDMVWTTTATNNVVAWLKIYAYNTVAASLTYGYNVFTVRMRFRQMN